MLADEGRGALTAAADNTITYAYNAQGQRTTKADQNGTVHAYTYDDGGRVTIDSAATLASSIDNAVQRIETAYNDRGMTASVTQYSKKDSGQSGDAPTDQVVCLYDGWGNLADYQQDNDGLVTGTGPSGGSNDYGVRYTYSKVGTSSGVSGTRRSAVRRTATTLRYAGGAGAAYGSAVHGWRYEFLNSSGDTLLDGDAGFATRLYKTADDGGSEVQLVEYRYGGDGRLLTTYIAVPELSNRHYSPSGGDPYGSYLDRWGREVGSEWLHTGGGVVYRATPAYDESSNITSVPQYHTPYGAVYEPDGLNRLVGAKVGVVSSGAISGTVFAEEDWTAGTGGALSLSQTGNWTKYIRSKDGSAELTAEGTFRKNNQYSVRDVDGSGSTALNYEVTYDNAGNLTDDDKPGVGSGRTESAYGFRYVYDAWNRLRKVSDGNGQSGPLVEELRYNGVGHLIAEHADTDGDGDVDSSDAWRHNQYNERWQLVAVYLNADAKPSEVYSFHNAGRDGFGGGSYIDALVCRDRDKDVDGSIVREERIYYVQNWRHDVVALVRADSTSDQKIVERIRYDAYGRPSSFSPADTARSGGVIGPDGAVDTNDDVQSVLGSGAQWYNDYASGSSGTVYLPDGTKNALDYTAFTDAYVDAGGNYGGGGFGVLSHKNLDNRVGYAGYRFDPVLNRGGSSTGKPVWHVRHRVLDSVSGKWLQMDPMGYVDGVDLYAYAAAAPMTFVDPQGLACASCAPPPEDGTEQCGPFYTPFGPCPGLPPGIQDDPEGPTFQKGWDSITRALLDLELLCESCCVKKREARGYNGPPRYVCCSPDECKAAARQIIQALLEAWLRHYGRGRYHDEPDPVGGYWCYDWARIYEYELDQYVNPSMKRSCFSWKRQQYRTKEGTYVHQFLTVTVCGCDNPQPRCEASFDDGFFDGKLYRRGTPRRPDYPLGPSPAQPGEHPQSPIPRPTPFTPTVRPVE